MRVGKLEKIVITRSETNFDKACESAYSYAIIRFKIDEDGHGPNFVRSTDKICVKFKSYEHTGCMVGQNFIYTFDAWIDRGKRE